MRIQTMTLTKAMCVDDDKPSNEWTSTVATETNSQRVRELIYRTRQVTVCEMQHFAHSELQNMVEYFWYQKVSEGKNRGNLL